MKESKFNIYTKCGNKELLFNSLYCGLCEVDHRYFSVLEKIKNNLDLTKTEQSIADMAVQAGYFVESDYDELDFLKMHKYKRKFDESRINITIAPTLACNFQCIYCYEDNRTGVMTDEIEKKLCSYIEEKASKLETLSVTWYGGEPLLAKGTIDRISKHISDICIENDIAYHAAIVTNGSLLNDDVIELFKKCQISTIQVTLDGPADIHNARRICSSIPNNFEVIVENINLLLRENLNVYIRVNVDKNNYNRMEELVDYLDKRLIHKKVNIGFAKVSACTDACVGVANDCFSTEEFAKEYFVLYEILEKYGFDAGTSLRYAEPRVNYCGADVYGSFVIDSFGYIYKCWHDVGDENRSLGSVSDIDAALMSPKAKKWLFSDALNNAICSDCKVLPLCMGGCPSKKFFEGKNMACDEIKYNISEILIRNYYKKVNEKGD